MIKKLRKKLVAVAMLSLFIVLFIIIGTVNVLNYTRMVDDADRTLNILKENNGSFPRPDMSHGHGGEMFKGMSPEAPYESRYFSVMMDSNGNVSTIDTGKIAGTDTDEAAEYAVKALASGKTEGFMGQYRFTLKEADSGSLIIFLYCGRGLSNFHSVLFISTAISIAGMLAVFLLLVFFSGRIVKPVSESYDKQKRFITDAGHELKTPLTIIDADAELVELECGESEWLDDQLYQHNAQHGAADQLTDAHRDAVGDAGQPDGGAGRGVREHHGDLNTDDHRVEQHRGQAGGNGQTLEAHIAQLVGDKAGQQGGKGAKDDIHDGRAQQVCQKAAQHHAENVLGTKHGQQAERLGHTHLHSTIGKGLQCQTQHHIDGCHYTAVHQLTDGRILIHDNTPAV